MLEITEATLIIHWFLALVWKSTFVLCILLDHILFVIQHLFCQSVLAGCHRQIYPSFGHIAIVHCFLLQKIVVC